MRWIKASERLPSEYEDVFWRRTGTPLKGLDNDLIYDMDLFHNCILYGQQVILFKDLEWLDEEADEVAISALKEIVSPIKYMSERLEEGERLNSYYATELSQDHNYLKKIAQTALENI